MEILGIMLATSITTTGLCVAFYIAFFIPVEKKKKKWSKCPTCGKWKSQ